MENHLPFKVTIFSLLLSIVLFTACSKDQRATSDPTKPQKGYATGKVTDSKGRPMAGAQILLDNTIVYAAYINATTNSDGTYKIKMPTGAYGIWKAYATIHQNYNGKAYTVNLCPDNTNSFNEEGAVCNFTWKLSGPVPGEDNSYFGGTIDMDMGINSALNGFDNITITLTPSGSLIDGSQGQTIAITFGDARWNNYNSGIKDIPMGRYKGTAVYHSPNGDFPLKLQNRQTNEGYQSEITFDFEPENKWGHKNAATLEIHE